MCVFATEPQKLLSFQHGIVTSEREVSQKSASECAHLSVSQRERGCRNVETVSQQQPFTHYWAHRSMRLRWLVKQDTAHNKGELKKARGAWRCSFWNSAMEMYKQTKLNFIAEHWEKKWDCWQKGFFFSSKLRKVGAELGESCHLASSMLPWGRKKYITLQHCDSATIWVNCTYKRPKAVPQSLMISQRIIGQNRQ